MLLGIAEVGVYTRGAVSWRWWWWGGVGGGGCGACVSMLCVGEEEGYVEKKISKGK